jgi:hypothetical protein
MVVGQSTASFLLALRLLYLDPGAESGRLKHKETPIMNWTFLIILTSTAFLEILSLQLIWRE